MSGTSRRTLELSTCVNIALGVSAAKEKSKVDRGSPWRRPRLERTYSCNDPLIRIRALAELRVYGPKESSVIEIP